MAKSKQHEDSEAAESAEWFSMPETDRERLKADLARELARPAPPRINPAKGTPFGELVEWIDQQLERADMHEAWDFGKAGEVLANVRSDLAIRCVRIEASTGCSVLTPLLGTQDPAALFGKVRAAAIAAAEPQAIAAAEPQAIAAAEPQAIGSSGPAEAKAERCVTTRELSELAERANKASATNRQGGLTQNAISEAYRRGRLKGTVKGGDGQLAIPLSAVLEEWPTLHAWIVAQDTDRAKPEARKIEHRQERDRRQGKARP